MNIISKQLIKIAKEINQESKNKTSSVKLSFNPQNICNELKIASKQYYKDKSICLRDKVLVARELNSISDEYKKIYTASYLSDLWQALTGKAGKNKEQMQQALENKDEIIKNFQNEQNKRLQEQKKAEQEKAKQLAQKQKNDELLAEADYQAVIKGIQEQYTRVTAEAKANIEKELNSVNTFLEAIKNSDQYEAFKYNKQVIIDLTQPVTLGEKGGQLLLSEKKFDITPTDYLIVNNVNFDVWKVKNPELNNKIAERFKEIKSLLKTAKSFFDEIQLPEDKIMQCLKFLSLNHLLDDATYYLAYVDVINGKIQKNMKDINEAAHNYSSLSKEKEYYTKVYAIETLWTDRKYSFTKYLGTNEIRKPTKNIDTLIAHLQEKFSKINKELQNQQLMTLKPKEVVQKVQKNIK